MRAKSLITALICIIVAVAGLAPAASAAAPKATPLEKVSSLVQPGIVYAQSTFSAVVRDPSIKDWIGNRTIKTFSVTYNCSGFFVNPDGYVATAGHCVQFDSSVKEDLIVEAAIWSFANEGWPKGWTEEDAINYGLENFKIRNPEDTDVTRPDRSVVAAYGVEVGGIPTGKDLPARVLGLRSFEGGDVALLKIEAENVPVLQLAPKADIEVGTSIVSVGYPADVDYVTDQTFDPSFKDGSVSSVKTVDDGLREVYEISGAMAGGMSGGPTVDLKGRVIGVNSFGSSEETEQFNFVSPVSEVEALMQDKGVENKLGATNTLYRKGLAAYYAGDRETAVGSFDQLLNQVEEHEFAQEFRGRALRLPKAADTGGGFPVLLLVIGLLVLAALAAAGMMLAKRRGQGGTPAPQRRQPMPPAPRTTPVEPKPMRESQPTPAPTPVATSTKDTVETRRPDMAPALMVLEGPLAGRRIELETEQIIGRGEVDIQLDDTEVSRRHASVRPLGNGVELTDLNSSNGTTLNGSKIAQPVQVSHGDVIGIGGTTIEVQLSEAARRDQATVLRAVR